jgi:hypothetical protein
MRGNITRRGKSSWRIKFDVGSDETGRRRYHVETVRGLRKDAEAVLAKRLNEFGEGRYVAPTVETVETYARHWLENIAPVDRSPLTLARYRTLIEVHIIPGIGGVPLKDMTGKAIDAPSIVAYAKVDADMAVGFQARQWATFTDCSRCC